MSISVGRTGNKRTDSAFRSLIRQIDKLFATKKEVTAATGGGGGGGGGTTTVTQTSFSRTFLTMGA